MEQRVKKKIITVASMGLLALNTFAGQLGLNSYIPLDIYNNIFGDTLIMKLAALGASIGIYWLVRKEII